MTGKNFDRSGSREEDGCACPVVKIIGCLTRFDDEEIMLLVIGKRSRAETGFSLPPVNCCCCDRIICMGNCSCCCDEFTSPANLAGTACVECRVRSGRAVGFAAEVCTKKGCCCC